MVPRTCNLVDLGAIGSAKTALQTPAVPFSQNRLLLGHTPSSAVMNLCRLARAAGSSAGGLSSREPDSESLKRRKLPRWSRPAGSIGLCGGSYCRRSSSPRLPGQGSGLQICCKACQSVPVHSRCRFSAGQNIYVNASTSSEGRKKNFCPEAIFRPQVWQS